LRRSVLRLAEDALSERPEPSEDDAIEQLIRDIDQLADALAKQQQLRQDADQRGEELLDVMMGIASGDYSRRASVGDSDTIFNALAAGLNMLTDELVAGQAAQLRLQAELINTQQAAIRELSTPLIPITDEVLVMPLIGTIDSRRAQDVLERLLAGIVEHRAQAVIVDITGVSVVDTQVANALIRAAQAIGLLGAQVVLTGIRPEVAQTLVGLGVDLRHIVTQSTLQAGIAYTSKQRSTGKPAASAIGGRWTSA
jgi:anti-anti-sigma regulatory factor